MSDITTVRNAIGDKLDPLGIIVYDRWEGDIVPPAALVVPARGTVIQYVTSTGSNPTHDAFFSIALLVSKSVNKYAQEELDKYISPTGSKSIYLAVSGELPGDLFCEVMEARGYGTVRIGTGETAHEYLGVEFLVSVGLYV